MTGVGLAVRWIHLVASVFLVGVFSTLLLGGATDRPTARAWESRLLTWARMAALCAIASGIVGLLVHTATLEGRAGAAFEPAALRRVLLETQAGRIWIARHGLLVLVAAFLLIRARLADRLDWIAVRGETFVLSLGAIGLVSASSHAAAVMPDTGLAIAVDVTHLAATGVWIGGLVPLGLLLRAASREEGADARPYAVLTARRFSRVAFVALIVLAATGIGNAISEIGDIAGLVGTAHGRLLLAKLVVLVVILGVARENRSRLIPALSGAASTIGRPAMRRLSRFVSIEASLALVLLGFVAVMTITPPARHQQPTWPFPLRFSAAPLADAPALATRVLIASQIGVIGLVGIASAILLRRHRWPLLGGGALLAVVAGVVALPPLTVDAYPTTYRRPSIPYQASAIAAGAALYRQHCVACHGAAGAPAGAAASRVGAGMRDLATRRVSDHTAGDLFWWISHGVPARGMPAFADRLGEAERWELVNFVRALGAGREAHRLGPSVEPNRPRVVAPDFAFSVGPSAPRALRDYRGAKLVLLVLYTLPASKPRLDQLALAYQMLTLLEVEVIAVPTDASPDAIRALGGEPPVLFPVVTDGAIEIRETYQLFARDPHAELLIDRRGYVRARWNAAVAEAGDVNLLLAEVQQLNAEKILAPPPPEHVH